MIQVNSKLKGLLALGVVLAGARIASADIIVTDGATQDAASGKYEYNVELVPGALLKAGDGLVIYDFPGLVTSGPDAPSLTGIPGFTFSVDQRPLGNDLSALSPSTNAFPTGNDVDAEVAALNFPGSGTSTTADESSVNNVSIVYNGSSQLGPTGDELGVLTLFSSVAGPGVTLNDLGATGSKDSSGPGSTPSSTEEVDSGNVTVPVVPEPASLALLGAVGLILGSGRRSRRPNA
jgi:PEP-CTERM motif